MLFSVCSQGPAAGRLQGAPPAAGHQPRRCSRCQGLLGNRVHCRQVSPGGAGRVEQQQQLMVCVFQDGSGLVFCSQTCSDQQNRSAPHKVTPPTPVCFLLFRLFKHYMSHDAPVCVLSLRFRFCLSVLGRLHSAETSTSTPTTCPPSPSTLCPTHALPPPPPHRRSPSPPPLPSPWRPGPALTA